MKKLCLILTVLYAIWANCSAQSLNNAGNLLDSNSSTFESGSSSWTCYDKDAWSIASEGGRNGKYLKLKHTGEVEDSRNVPVERPKDPFSVGGNADAVDGM